MKIGLKMALGFGVVLAILLAVSLIAYFNTTKLATLEADLVKRSNEAVAVREMAGMGNAAYSVIADAVINRDFAAVNRDWREVQQEMKEDIARMEALVDHPDEVRWAKEVKAAEEKMNALFTEELLPLLQQEQTAETIARVRDLDEQIDREKNAIASLCQKLSESLTEEMHKAEERFEASADQTQTLLLILTVLALLIASVVALVLSRGITNPLATLVSAANGLRHGDIQQQIDIERSDELGELADAFKGMIAQQKKKADVAARLADGDLSAKVDVASEKDTLGHALEKLQGNIRRLIDNMNHMSHEHDAGDIDVVIPVNDFNGAYRDMADGVNKMVNGHIAVKKKAMACVAEFGRGNFDAHLEQFPGKKAFINETIEGVRSNIKKFIADMNHMSHEHDAGDIDVVIPVNEFSGSFKEMASGVNNMVNGHIAVKKKAMACIREFGNGNFDAPLESFPGKKAFINETIEAVRANLKGIAAEVERLIEASRAGNLKERGEAGAFNGGWESLIEGVNELLDTILQPINEASYVLDELANYNLTARVKGDYRGDHARIKNALNTTGKVLHDAMAQVQQAVGQVNSAAQQISISSQQVAEGASEQASSLEETTSSMEEMSGMTKQNADNTRQAQTLAEDTR
ncbi:MAG: HAMP domain-containing protein, partial [Deltaproteobacteria bacterium]|nr:HAMP domain-containing protein [Deltaproteobacteria bacterium]